MNIKITQNTCRICLLSNRKVNNIFSISHYDDYDNGLKLGFKQKLEIHCGIEIEENDGLPSNICIECIAKINSAHNLWKQCQISDKKLKEFYNKSSEKDVKCVTPQDVLDHNEVKKLHHLRMLSSLKESIELNKLPHNKNNSTQEVNDKKINNINESKSEYKQKLYDLNNLNTKKTIDRKRSLESVNSSCTPKKLELESKLNNNICKEITLKVQTNPPKNLDSIIYFPINDDTENNDINIKNTGGFMIIKTNNGASTSPAKELNYIIENDHCYTTFVKPAMEKSPRKSPPIILNNNNNNNDTVNKFDKSIKSTNIDQNICYVCGKVYIRKAALRRHMKYHNKLFRERGFECEICKKKLGSNASLKLHLISHQGVKPYKCKYCNRGFLTDSKRIYHERSHTLERPYVCDLCDATYPQMHLLKLHITKHTGENKYLCEKCGKSFRMYKCLKEHQFTHTKEKPFVCSNNCGMAYSNSGSLFAHKKRCCTKTQPLIT